MRKERRAHPANDSASDIIDANEQDYNEESMLAETPGLSTREMAVLFIKQLFKDPAVVKRFLVMSPSEERYVRPQRPYELPLFRDDMRYCTSNEKYLRPTLFCNPREPAVIAMANELGAYEKTDYEFAEAALAFVKYNMKLELCPINNVTMTLERGTGGCWHLINVFVALCRAAEIKVSLYSVKSVFREEQRDFILGLDPFFEKMYEALNFSAFPEVYINDKWMDADVVSSPEMQAIQGFPITKLGEGSMGTFVELVPGPRTRFESMPSWITRGMKMLKWFAPALMERVNVSTQKQLALGRKIIEEAGGIEAYDKKAREERGIFLPREERGIFLPITDLEYDKPIVFKE